MILGNRNQIEYARELGKKSYLAGKHCCTSSDKEFSELLRERGYASGKYNDLDPALFATVDELIKAYHEGFNSKNPNRLDPNKLGL
jgi:hypothetical protein